MNINQLMQQAQKMQKKFAEMQEKLASCEYTGTAGGGMVNVTITGKGELTKLKLDPSIVSPEDTEVLEDLVVAAFNDAKKKADTASESEMGGAFGGLNLPAGFKMPF